jgi:hypothetical protein
MLPAVRSWLYTDGIQKFMPPGIEARAVYTNWGRIVAFGVMDRRRNTAKVEVLRTVLERAGDRYLRLTANFLLDRLAIEAERNGGKA